MDTNVKQALEKWKEANRALLHYQQESHFALVRLLDAICDRIEKLSESQRSYSDHLKKKTPPGADTPDGARQGKSITNYPLGTILPRQEGKGKGNYAEENVFKRETAAGSCH